MHVTFNLVKNIQGKTRNEIKTSAVPSFETITAKTILKKTTDVLTEEKTFLIKTLEFCNSITFI